MSVSIAIDAGHGYTKALSATAQTIFPSLICPAPASVDLGDYAHSQAIQIDGTATLVGESARAHATPLWSRDKATDPDTLRLILVAAAELGATGPVALATGLPLAWYGSQRRAFRDALTGYGATIERPGQAPQRIWFEAVKVLPQGLSAAGPILIQAIREPGDYLVVDIGYRTTDYLIVSKSPNGRLDYAPDAAGSLPMGTGAVGKALADAVSQQYQVEFSPPEVESVPTVTIRGQHIDLTQRRHAANQAVGKQLLQSLALELGSTLDKLIGIIVVGGGSDILTHLLPTALVSDQPQWANVQGYWSALHEGP